MALRPSDAFLSDPLLPHEQLRGAVTQQRFALVKLGYKPGPVLSGRKGVVLPGWTEVRTDLDTVGKWAQERPGELSTGIRTKDTPGIDIDIHDAAVAEEVKRIFLALLCEGGRRGSILERVGQPPKRLIPVRCDKPFKKQSVTFASPDGTIHKVEVL